MDNIYKRIQLLLLFRLTEKKINGYLREVTLCEDLEDAISLYAMYKKRLLKRIFVASPVRVTKELTFLQKNLKFYGDIDTKDKAIMTTHLLSTSIERMA